VVEGSQESRGGAARFDGVVGGFEEGAERGDGLEAGGVVLEVVEEGEPGGDVGLGGPGEEGEEIVGESDGATERRSDGGGRRRAPVTLPSPRGAGERGGGGEFGGEGLVVFVESEEAEEEVVVGRGERGEGG
jgi:hypothetical protein